MRRHPVVKTSISSSNHHSSFSQTDTTIIYEQPLNERVRSFLRLEHLFENISARINGTSEWDSRAALAGLIDVADFLSRADIKTELIKELERHVETFIRLQPNPEVDAKRLNEVLERLNIVLVTLKDRHYQPAQALRQDEFVTVIKQRTSIPVGTCNFDVPAYHYWLNKPAIERIQQLHRWFEDLRIIEAGIALALATIRESTAPIRVIAAGGFYQQTLEPNHPCQLLRIVVPANKQVFPEISAGKHRFTLRFLELPARGGRPVQTERDVEFELQCCTL